MIPLDVILFYLFGGAAVACSLAVVLQRNPMHSVLLLIASFAALAGLYITLDSPFTAVTQIIVYAGAIMVLFLFVVMLLNAPHEDTEFDERTHPLLRPGPMKFGALLAVLLIVQLGWALTRAADFNVPVGGRADGGTVSSVRELGRVLFGYHAFAFEATSVLILVAMLGAVVLARREEPTQ